MCLVQQFVGVPTIAFQEKRNSRRRDHALENSLPGLQGEWVGNGMPRILSLRIIRVKLSIWS